MEICNNLVENAIRPTKLDAKNWLFIGNEMSGQKCAILYTIVENCRRLGINPKEYLTDVTNYDTYESAIANPYARHFGPRLRNNSSLSKISSILHAWFVAFHPKAVDGDDHEAKGWQEE